MINLIRNELSKIFHRKVIYVLGIVSVGIIFLNFLIYLLSSNMVKTINEASSSIIEQNLSSYDLNNPEQFEYYVNQKAELDIVKLQKEYDYYSWEYATLENNFREPIRCMVEAEHKKDYEMLDSCKKTKEEYLEKLKDGDWKFFIELDKEQYSNSEIDIPGAKTRLEMLDYRIKHEVPYSYDYKSLLIDNFVELSSQYESLLDEDLYNSYDEKKTASDIKARYMETKYILDNDIEIAREDDVSNILKMTFSGTIFFAVIVVILIGGSIIADEFNKGTIKQLLLKPYTRTQIILSKYITCIIVFFLYMLFYLLCSTIIYGFLHGWSSLGIPVIVYNHTTGNVMEISIWSYVFMHILSLLPLYLILMTAALFIGTISGSTVLSIAISFVGYFMSSIVSLAANSVKYKFLRYFPTLCWDLSEYLYGGMSSYKYGTLLNSIIVDVVTIVILVAGTIIVFNKKEIKNQ